MTYLTQFERLSNDSDLLSWATDEVGEKISITMAQRIIQFTLLTILALPAMVIAEEAPEKLEAKSAELRESRTSQTQSVRSHSNGDNLTEFDEGSREQKNNAQTPSTEQRLASEEAGITGGAIPSETATEARQPVAEADPVEFDVFELQISGNNLLPGHLIERVVYPHLGTGKSLADIEAIRLTLEKLYHGQGYQTVVVSIPEQEVKAGVVRLHVTEGTVANLAVLGARYYSPTDIRAEVGQVRPGNVPHFPTLQQELGRLGMQTSDRNITPIFKAGRTTGTLDVDLKVKDRLPVHGSIELNDRNTKDTSRTRLVTNLSYNNLWQQYHSASVTWQTAPEESEEVDVWSISYSLPMGQGNQLVAYAIDSDSQSDISGANALRVLGRGEIIGLRMVRTLKPLVEYFHSISFGLDHKDVEEEVALLGGGTLLTPIEFSKVAVEYRGFSANQQTNISFSLGAHFALRGLGANEEEFEDKRFKARPNFFYWTVQLSAQRELGRVGRLVARLQGQYSDQPLINNEQFSVGGVDTVRGYYSSQQLGDTGATTSLEWHTPAVPGLGRFRINDLHALLFSDYGSVKSNALLPGEAEHSELYSLGVGFRLQTRSNFSAQADWAQARKDSASVLADEDRWHFNLRYQF